MAVYVSRGFQFETGPIFNDHQPRKLLEQKLVAIEADRSVPGKSSSRVDAISVKWPPTKGTSVTRTPRFFNRWAISAAWCGSKATVAILKVSFTRTISVLDLL